MSNGLGMKYATKMSSNCKIHVATDGKGLCGSWNRVAASHSNAHEHDTAADALAHLEKFVQFDYCTRCRTGVAALAEAEADVDRKDDDPDTITSGTKVTLPDGEHATVVEMDDADREFFRVPAGAVVVRRAGAAEGEEEYYFPADLTPAAEQVASGTITADEIRRNDRVRLPGDDLPYLVDRAWTGSDGMVYIQFSSGDEEQYLPGDVFDQHPITGTLTRKSA